MVPDNAPVLAGQTRSLLLTQKTADGAKPLVLNYPLTIKGLLEWEDGAFQIDASIP